MNCEFIDKVLELITYKYRLGISYLSAQIKGCLLIDIGWFIHVLFMYKVLLQYLSTMLC